MKKKRIIIGAVVAILLLAVGGTFLLLKSDNNEPGSLGWKKQQYSAICERGVKEGLETNTTEYSICTRDLGYSIKAIEPKQDSQKTEQKPSQNSENSDTAPNDELRSSQKAGCVSLRATNLDDLIATNKQNGISEADTRTTHNSGIAQCNTLGY